MEIFLVQALHELWVILKTVKQAVSSQFHGRNRITPVVLLRRLQVTLCRSVIRTTWMRMVTAKTTSGMKSTQKIQTTQNML
jgi:hypothetical protein